MIKIKVAMIDIMDDELFIQCFNMVKTRIKTLNDMYGELAQYGIYFFYNYEKGKEIQIIIKRLCGKLGFIGIKYKKFKWDKIQRTLYLKLIK